MNIAFPFHFDSRGRTATATDDGGIEEYQPRTLIDSALAQYPRLWAAAGHPHCVFETTYESLRRLTGGDLAHVD